MLALATLLAGGSGHAQEAADAVAAEAIARSRAAIGPVSPEQRRKACLSQDKSGDIVVCAPGDDKQFRVQSSSELDPNSRRSTRTGIPRAPDLAPKYNGVKVLQACLIPPCPPPPMYMLDFSTLAETPKGSDAEKVANGEMAER